MLNQKLHTAHCHTPILLLHYELPNTYRLTITGLTPNAKSL